MYVADGRKLKVLKVIISKCKHQHDKKSTSPKRGLSMLDRIYCFYAEVNCANTVSIPTPFKKPMFGWEGRKGVGGNGARGGASKQTFSGWKISKGPISCPEICFLLHDIIGF